MTADVVVLGDLCLDTVASARLPFSLGSTELADETAAWVPLNDRPGGSAFHFSVWARRFGLAAVVVGCVGEDLAGDFVLRSLAREGIEAKIARSGSSPTGRVVIAYDVRGVRLLLASAASANDDLSEVHVRDAWRMVGACRMLWLSGLCLRRAEVTRIEAAVVASNLARAAGGWVVLDLVPHDFIRYYPSLDAVVEVVGPLQGVVSELRSLRPLLGCGDGCDPADLDRAVDRLLEHTELAIVRAREGDLYRQVARSRDGFDEECTRTAPTEQELPGFGDALACEALSRLLARPALGAPQ